MSGQSKSPVSKETDIARTSSERLAPFIVISIANIVLGGGAAIFGQVKIDIATDLGVSLATLMGTQTYFAVLAALMIIPAAMLVSRFSPRVLAWASLLLISIGSGTLALSGGIALFYVGSTANAIGTVLFIPILGQAARDSLSTRSFVFGTTIALVLYQLTKAIALIAIGLSYEFIGWRNLYFIWAALAIPLVIALWWFIKPSNHLVDSEPGDRLLQLPLKLFKNPLVWISGLSSGLIMATASKFAFVWNINMQKAMGWDNFDSNLLVFMFAVGLIAGGFFVIWLSKRTGSYHAILICTSLGAIAFSLCLFFASSLHLFWLSLLLDLSIGIFLGTGTMIVPYISSLLRRETTAIFFGIAQGLYWVIASFIVIIPAWILPDETVWSVPEIRLSLIPYAIALILGVGIFALIGLYSRREARHLTTD